MTLIHNKKIISNDKFKSYLKFLSSYNWVLFLWLIIKLQSDFDIMDFLTEIEVNNEG